MELAMSAGASSSSAMSLGMPTSAPSADPKGTLFQFFGGSRPAALQSPAPPSKAKPPKQRTRMLRRTSSQSVLDDVLSIFSSPEEEEAIFGAAFGDQ